MIRLAFKAGATTSQFGLEGPLRAGIRSDLCLLGWTWESADLMARELLNEAFFRVRVERPTWAEGQREWTIEAGTLIERTRCMRCHKPLPEGHHNFRARVCSDAAQHRLELLKQGNEETA